jgi:hypothetical protein
MARTLALAVLLTQSAVPAPAAPVPKGFPAVPRLEGTAWEGDGVVAPTTYRFEKDGVLVYTYNGTTYRNGTWKQDGKKVYWECNNRYCEYDGTVERDELRVRAWNVAGGRWELVIKRRKDPEK